MSKFKVGDKVLRAGVGKSRWKWRIVGIRGHLWWKKALLETKVNDDLLIEEYLYKLYLYEELPDAY